VRHIPSTDGKHAWHSTGRIPIQRSVGRFRTADAEPLNTVSRWWRWHTATRDRARLRSLASGVQRQLLAGRIAVASPGSM
jgi:hypothetical protein